MSWSLISDSWVISFLAQCSSDQHFSAMQRDRERCCLPGTLAILVLIGRTWERGREVLLAMLGGWLFCKYQGKLVGDVVQIFYILINFL